jgi:predicted dehydrogenase
VREDQRIGFGVIGLRRGKSLASALATIGGAVLSAVYDVDTARVDAEASDLGATGYADLDAFLASDADVVVVASPLPFHAAQSIAALSAGKHVISEVLPCTTLDEARALVTAIRASGRRYMLAENCVFYDNIELLKRLHDAGRLGHVYYAEGDYVHDCSGLWYGPDGQLTWRGRGELGVYGTHGLGPLLYLTGDRVACVSCLAVPGGLVDPNLAFPTMHLLQMTTEGGRTFRTRVDAVSPRPHTSTTSFVVQGTDGSFASAQSASDTDRIWLRDRHPTTDQGAPAAWHSLDALSAEVIPDRLEAPKVAGGHGATEYWMLKAWCDALRRGSPEPIGVKRALDMTLPCIVAQESAAQGGTPVPVPDPRDW